MPFNEATRHKVATGFPTPVLDAFSHRGARSARCQPRTFAHKPIEVIIGGRVGPCQTRSKNWTNTLARLTASAPCVHQRYGSSRTNSTTPPARSPTCLHPQSGDIAQGVDASRRQGRRGRRSAGIMFGSRPLKNARADAWRPIHLLPMRNPAPSGEVRKDGNRADVAPSLTRKASFPCAMKTGQTCCVFLYRAVDAAPPTRGPDQAPISRYCSNPISPKSLPEGWITPDTEWWVNPTGTFRDGVPDGELGLTGSQIHSVD